MKNKDKVKEKYPDAYAEKFQTTHRMSETIYFLIWEKPLWTGKNRLGEGDTEAKAWKDAWEKITDTQKPFYLEKP